MIKFELEGKFKYKGKTFVQKMTVEDGNILEESEHFADRTLKMALKQAIKGGSEKLFVDLLEINHGPKKI